MSLCNMLCIFTIYIVQNYIISERKKKLTGRITADGFDAATNTALFVDGCFWHAHECQKRHGNVKHPVRIPFTYREIQQQTFDRNRAVLAAGYNICIKTECQIMAELKRDLTMRVSQNYSTVFDIIFYISHLSAVFR